MAQIEIPLSDEAMDLVVENVRGSLHVKGWGRDKVRVEVEDSKDLSQQEKGGKLLLSSEGDLLLRIPSEVNVTVKSVDGEASLSSLEGELNIGTIRGSLTLRDVAETQIDEASGNLTARDIEGGLSVQEVSGNLTARNVEGELASANVRGNAILREIEGRIDLPNVEGNFSLRDGGLLVVANARGNASLRQDLDDDADYTISAQGNIACRLDTTPNAKVVLESRGENILVQTDESSQVFHGPQHEIRFGNEEASLQLSAGGNIDFRCREDEEGFNLDLDLDFMDDIGSMVDEISGQVSSQMEAQLEALNSQLESLGERLHSSGERSAHQAQRRVEDAQRRLERKLEARRRSGKVTVMPVAPFGGRGKAEPVSEEERMLVLQMVQENKITVREAEILLNTLEGRAVDPETPSEPGESTEPVDEEAKDS